MESAIRSLSGGGRPLSQPERSFFEPRFGTDFSRVRLHSGDSAGGLAETVQAQAFTVGHHIVFGTGQFEPGTPAGRRLLAHELTHVTQQTAANPTQGPAFPHVQRQPRPGKAGPREATVVIRWTEDQDKFYDRLLATLAGSPGFRGIDPKEFEYYSDTEPGLRAFSDSLHTSYGMHHSDRKVGDAVKVHFSADYDAHHEYHASDLTNKKISLVAETTVVKKPEKPVPPPPPPVAKQKSDDPIDEENFPGYAWHQVGSTFEGTKPSVAVVRAIVAENTDLDRDLLTATTATPFYRNYVKAGTIRPSYFSYRHPTKGIVARAFAEREGLPAEGESDPKLWLKESFSYKVYIFSPHPAKDTPHYAFRMPPSAAPPPAPTEAEQEAYRALAEVPLAHP